MDKYVFTAIKNLIDNTLNNGIFTYEQLQGKTYIWTNECVDRYLNLLNPSSKNNAITVLGSGDQLFSLISKGIIKIDTIDVNRVAEYYALGLKKALIRRYDYNEFLYFWSTVNSPYVNIYDITKMLLDVISYMDIRYRETWKKIIDYNAYVQDDYINLFQIIGYNANYNIELIKELNSYLKDETSYNKVRNNIDNVSISYKEMSAINLKKENIKYDIILLSNVLDYFYKEWDIYTDEKIEQYASEILELLSNDGAAMFYYLFNDTLNMKLPESMHDVYSIGNDEVVILKKTK